MNYQFIDSNSTKEVVALFTSVFTVSEGEKEGELIGKLASGLAPNINNEETFCFGAYENGFLAGSIFFTRLKFNNPILVYMLSPVAVSTELQGKGIGQALINYGIEELRKRSVDVVVTYGDPNYYCKVGFEPLSESVIQAPLPLSMPHGWLGQSLTDKPIPTIDGRPVCAEEFNNPDYW